MQLSAVLRTTTIGHFTCFYTQANKQNNNRASLLGNGSSRLHRRLTCRRGCYGNEPYKTALVPFECSGSRGESEACGRTEGQFRQTPVCFQWVRRRTAFLLTDHFWQRHFSFRWRQRQSGCVFLHTCHLSVLFAKYIMKLKLLNRF